MDDGAVEQRRDTKILELVAEHFVSHSLGRYGILCAKPYFDQMGADLLGIIDIWGHTLYFLKLYAYEAFRVFLCSGPDR